jgi:hypothetical protein
VGVAAVVLMAGPAAAGTTVNVKGGDVTISVPIDCAGCKGAKAPDGSDLATYWKKSAEKIWNDAFATFPYCSKYKFMLDVKINAKAADFKGKKGDHRVQVSDQPSANTFPPSGFEHSSGGKDNPDAYQGDFDGALDIKLDPNTVAHEIGHVLGLTDDYTTVRGPPRQTTAKPGRENTLMAEHDRNGKLSSVDKALVDRIGKQLENLNKIDKCKEQVWTGTAHGHIIDNSFGITCISDWDANLTLTVVGNGQAAGQLTMVNAPVNSCGGKDQFLGQTFPLIGQMTTNQLHLQLWFAFKGDHPVTISRSRGRASGTGHALDPTSGGSFDQTTMVQLTCTNCAPSAAVG